MVEMIVKGSGIVVTEPMVAIVKEARAIRYFGTKFTLKEPYRIP